MVHKFTYVCSWISSLLCVCCLSIYSYVLYLVLIMHIMCHATHSVLVSHAKCLFLAHSLAHVAICLFCSHNPLHHIFFLQDLGEAPLFTIFVPFVLKNKKPFMNIYMCIYFHYLEISRLFCHFNQKGGDCNRILSLMLNWLSCHRS